MNQNNKVVSFGDIMMRLSPPSYERFVQAKQMEVNYGGSEGNVAVSLAHFGVNAEHVTCFPENDFGKAATAHLQAHGVATHHIAYGKERMGVYFIEHGTDHRSPKIIYDRFDSAFANLKPALFNWPEILRDASWFHWSGITPALSATAAEACYDAIRTARKFGIKISADINYRRNLWQYGKNAIEVMPQLIAESDIVVGGLPDFENCMEIKSTDFEDACKKVQKKFPTILKMANTERKLITTSFQKLLAVLWNGTSLLRSKEYEITHVVDRVGSGDAFMAGLIYGLVNGIQDKETLEFAAAAGVLKHTIPGDVNTVTVEEVNALVIGDNVGKLLR
jgi:2-dehydro-3-deoxygluconokinase